MQLWISFTMVCRFTTKIWQLLSDWAALWLKGINKLDLVFYKMYGNVLFLPSHLNICNFALVSYLVSTYVVCERLSVMSVASWSGWKFGSKFWECPTLRNRALPPPPPKLKFRQILALEDFSVWLAQKAPPPTPENWNLGRSWHFETFQFWLAQNTHKPPKNLYLGRSWHFKTFQFWLAQNTPSPQIEI